MDTTSSPRMSFSVELLDDNDFISINPVSRTEIIEKEQEKICTTIDFEFFSEKLAADQTMLTADQLFFEGKLLPFNQMPHLEKFSKICLKPLKQVEGKEKEENIVSWFIDEDPSPRPPKCTVLWKELLRLKKQKSSSLSPSSSSSSNSTTDTNSGDDGKDISWNKEKHVKKIKQELQRAISANIRIRPAVNVPICTPHGRSSTVLPPFFSLKKGNLER